VLGWRSRRLTQLRRGGGGGAAPCSIGRPGSWLWAPRLEKRGAAGVTTGWGKERRGGRGSIWWWRQMW
jgi:hypothetical protein